jgi:hypothetical protein
MQRRGIACFRSRILNGTQKKKRAPGWDALFSFIKRGRSSASRRIKEKGFL